MAIDQIDTIPTSNDDKKVSVSINSSLLKVGTADADAIILKSGDSVGSAVAAKAITLANSETPADTPTVTFKNGSDTFATVASANGKVVLPDVTTTKPTLAASGYVKAFTFVGWVDNNGVDVTADTTITENMTVYAKYNTGYVIGDVNGDGSVNMADRAMIIPYVGANGAQAIGNIGKELVNAQSLYVIGDVNGDRSVNMADRAMIIPYVGANGAQTIGNIGKPVYYINK